jgi:hypothetical protein
MSRAICPEAARFALFGWLPAVSQQTQYEGNFMRYLVVMLVLLGSISAAYAGPSAQGQANSHHQNAEDNGATKTNCGHQGSSC